MINKLFSTRKKKKADAQPQNKSESKESSTHDSTVNQSISTHSTADSERKMVEGGVSDVSEKQETAPGNDDDICDDATQNGSGAAMNKETTPAPATASKCPFAAAAAVASAPSPTTVAGVDIDAPAQAPATASKCPFAAAAAVASTESASTSIGSNGEASPSKNPSAAASGDDDGLQKFLSDANKSQFRKTLVEGGFNTVDDLAKASVDDLAKVLPSKTVARLLHKKAAEKVGSEAAAPGNINDLQKFLSDANKAQFHSKLVEAGYTTVGDLAKASVEDLAKVLPSKTVARLLHKKAAEKVSSGAAGSSNGDDLQKFLSDVGKDQFYGTLSKAGFITVDDLAKASVEDLAKGLPSKTVARLLHKKAAERVSSGAAASSNGDDLQKFLSDVGKIQFYDTLSKAGYTTVGDLAKASVEDLAKVLPSKTVARLLHKKAAERVDTTTPAANASSQVASKCPFSSPTIVSLKDFLIKSKKEKFYDHLIGANVNTVQDLAKSSVDDLAKAVPKTIARLLQRKAAEAVAAVEPSLLTSAPAKANAADDPKCPTKLPTQTIVDIRKIWTTIQSHTQSVAAAPFGEVFYTKLMTMDADAMSLFSDVHMSILSRDFDWAITDYIAALSPFPGGPIVAKRDDFVGRLIKYGASARTLWLAGDAFRFAAMAVSPRLESKGEHRGLEPWAELYYKTLVPPLHPTILRSIEYADPSHFAGPEAKASLHKALLKTGRFYAADLITKLCPELLERIAACVASLGAWKEGKGGWSAFVQACEQISNLQCRDDGHSHDGHSHNGHSTSARISLDGVCTLLTSWLPAAFAISFPHEEAFCRQVDDTLLVIAGRLCGPLAMVSALRARQLETVIESWEMVYARAHKEFATNFYGEFLKDPRIARVFERTAFAMQQQRFVHQLNAIIIRLGEDPARVLLPLIHELGARHRVHFAVGPNELQSSTKVIVSSMKDMYGQVFWTPALEDAWHFATEFLVSHMLVGWTCGLELSNVAGGTSVNLSHQDEINIENNQGKQIEWANIELGKLRALRNESPDGFSSFFAGFAGKQSSSQTDNNLSMTAARYQKVVNLILDEDDLMLSRERLSMLGRRHKQFHGVTLEHLKKVSLLWMTLAKDAFGSNFTFPVAQEWAKLWTLIASSFDHAYSPTRGCPTSKDLAAPYKPKIDLMASITAKPYKSRLHLEKKNDLPGSIAHLIFRCDPPLASFKAGQYAKIRWSMPDGKQKTRFYSIASPPSIDKAGSKSMELCIKEVSNGLVSPFVVGDFVPPATCELVMAAGHFTLPSPLKDTSRLVVSGGIGIVAFIGVIRSAAELCRTGKLASSKLSLSMLHTERSLDFPFKDILLGFAEEFRSDEGKDFCFSLMLCITRGDKEDVNQAAKENPNVSWKSERPDRHILQSMLDDLSTKAPPGTSSDVYVCGPGPFQKATRKILIDGIGLNKRAVHQEFFDL